MHSKGNYSFGGRTSLLKLRNIKPTLAVRDGGTPHIAASTGNLHKLNKSVTLKKPIETVPLYEAVGYTPKVHDGLLYRGKYCGKSQY